MGKKHEHKGKYMQPSSTLFISVPSLSHVQLFATPWTVAYQAFPSMGFSRQEYWSGMPLCPTLCDPMDCSTWLSCPSQNPGACSNSCPLSWWCHPTLSCSVVPFSSHLQSFPASGSFSRSHFLASGGQSIGVSASASSFQWIFRTDFLQDWQIWSPFSPRGSQESSPNWTQRKKVEERHTHL